MLVLSRKKNQKIVINENITLTVLEVRGGKVRLGIEAPEEVTVHRQETHDAIRRQSQRSEVSDRESGVRGQASDSSTDS